jgi:hypothetical protein
MHWESHLDNSARIVCLDTFKKIGEEGWDASDMECICIPGTTLPGYVVVPEHPVTRTHCFASGKTLDLHVYSLSTCRNKVTYRTFDIHSDVSECICVPGVTISCITGHAHRTLAEDRDALLTRFRAIRADSDPVTNSNKYERCPFEGCNRPIMAVKNPVIAPQPLTPSVL